MTFEVSPSEKVCDFCSDDDPKWNHPCETFLLLGGLARSLQEWTACNACHDFIEREEWAQLAVRAAAKLGWQLELVMHIHEQFRKHRKGGAATPL